MVCEIQCVRTAPKFKCTNGVDAICSKEPLDWLKGVSILLHLLPSLSVIFMLTSTLYQIKSSPLLDPRG